MKTFRLDTVIVYPMIMVPVLVRLHVIGTL